MAGPSLADALTARGATRRVLVGPELWALLGALVPTGAMPATGDATGELIVQAGDQLPLPGLVSFALAPGDDLGYVLSTPPDGSLRVDLVLRRPLRLPAELRPARLTPADRLVATGAAAAEVTVAPGGGPGLGLRIAGTPDGTATLRFLAPGADDALTTLVLQGADGVLLGDSGFGLDLRGGLIFDDSRTQAPPPPGAGADPAHYPSRDPAWRGIALRGARLLVPERTPFVGGAAVAIDLDLGTPTGLAGRVKAHLPAQAGRPELDATVEWHDPAAASLASAVPTLVELAVKLPAHGATMPDPAGGSSLLTLAGGDPVVLRGRYSRDPQGDDLRFDLAVDGVGPKGLVSITVSDQSGAAADVARVCVTGAALAAAFVAESSSSSDAFPDATGVGLVVLLAAAHGLSSVCQDGSLVVHGVAIEGDVRAAATELSLLVDYSAELQVADFHVGPVTIGMRPHAPLRVRYRDVRLRVRTGATGPGRFALSFAGARVDVEDPGGWFVEPPGPLGLAVGDTRSGHGSTWFEVDLRVAVDLGPVKVSGATVRGTLTGDPSNPIRAELHGFDVGVNVPGVLEGSGSARFAAGSLDADLGARIVPLGIGGFASVSTREADGLRMVFVELGLDLPGAIPLANSGLGVYGLSGAFGYNAGLPPHDPARDPIDEMIERRPLVPVAQPGMLLGFGLVVGTVADLGYAFSALGSLAVAVPDLELRVGLQARFVAERPRFADLGQATSPPVGLRIVGLLEANSRELLIALRGTFDVPHLLKITVPVAARFPFTDPDWWLHVGSDGVDGRTPAPVSVQVLPELLNLGGSGYLMVHGAGIRNLGGIGVDLGGFSLGLGLAFHTVLGAFPIVYGDISAGVVVGLGSHPLLMLGRARVDGSLHLGPFSLGLSADLDVQVGPGDVRWMHVHVCGEIDLFFTSISGCVDIDVGGRDDAVPPPDTDPLVGVALTDGAGVQIEAASESPLALPQVWPDVMPVLQFSTGPATELVDGPFVQALVVDHAGAESAGDGRYGSADLSYRFFLTGLELERMGPGASATPVPGPLLAAWQLPRHGDPVGSTRLPGARDLGLLTRERHGWMRVLDDGGASLPHDPLGTLGTICHLRFAAAPGWALGGAAREDVARWRLPSDPGDPLARFPSSFEVEVTLAWSEEITMGPLWGGGDLPSPFPWTLGGAGPLPAPVELAERAFPGGLVLPHLLELPVDGDGAPDPDVAAFLGDPPPAATLAFTEELVDPVLVLVAHESLLDRIDVQGRATAGVSDRAWRPVEVVEVAERTLAAAFAPVEDGAKWSGVRVGYPPFAPTLVLGVRGLTAKARDAATDVNIAIDGSAGEQTTAAGAPQPVPSRSLLDRGTHYRLRVSQRWEGRRSSGASAGGDWPERTFHFRTADATDGGDVLSILRRVLLRDFRAFDPAYLERYLAGYTPVDHARDWFRDDPVAAHFRFDHVAALARRYGHDLALWLRRTDTPPGRPDDHGQAFEQMGWMLLPSLLSAADRRLAALAASRDGDCRIAPAGATVSGDPALDPLATYDLSVRFPPQGQPPSHTDRGLPGVVLTTSRYRGPAELLGAFGAARDVAVGPVVLGGHATGDAALEAALAALGLAGRTPPRAPTASALWVPAGDGWRLAGVLLESPEPLERAGGRMTVTGIACPGGSFDVSRRDTSGTRLLRLASTPFPPGGDLTIAAQEVRPLAPPGTGPAALSVACGLAASPVFAQDRAA